ncbi:uncharacterized protein LOC128737334 [Sabethes cyaneus]|uniref:uncharacterized protein LOC128737334 n=1 Tax=Sabethes cyaneus TaxID=53552 RepID=UPI00237E9FBF|nr:uncharacterized protein LOC128737334 [Sabethes cyaneus]XP_053687927.1 uncharacterized protein LOC128737334 [Sabethes cyaneus]
MSLVAYDYSSDDGSESEEVEQPKTTDIELNKGTARDDPYLNTDIDLENEEIKRLPLPVPKTAYNKLNIKEEDDEFLQKKAIPEAKPAPATPFDSIRANKQNGKVQIAIPSLRDFIDEDKSKGKPKLVGAQAPKKSTGLLNMLPKPKFATFSSVDVTSVSLSKPVVNRLVPDSVANRTRRVAGNDADAEVKMKHPPKSTSSNVGEDSDDEENTDFFSFNSDEKLPEISANEITLMVAKKAAKMAEAVKKFDDPTPQEHDTGRIDIQQETVSVEYESNQLGNKHALATLIGGNKAKRARADNVSIIDINSADIVPSKDDFLRRKLQEETGYVPTGHLTGDWTCTSKRKSHITYLATKAQANAQELEAMWSSNRQSRRQTQSKYGF